MLSNWDFGDARSRLQQEAERLASTARNGQLVLFVGAGASAGAGVPTWQELLTTLSAGYVTPDELEQLKSLDLRESADRCCRRRSMSPHLIAGPWCRSAARSDSSGPA